MQRCSAQAVFPLLFLLLAGSLQAAAQDVFPRPAELEDDIRFWTRVYTEIDTEHGFIHDARHLGVVYETMEAPGDGRSRGKRIERRRAHYAGILHKLARGNRQGLGAEEERVLALWPGASNADLRAAAGELRFQLGQSDRFREGYIRAGAWIPHIQRIFAEEGLPPELGFLPHVESSFNPKAYSHAAAAGLWQFTSYTGRRFMRVDHVVDERMDPFLATRAAARLLKENYAELGEWPLALTAYNHGVNGMRKAVRSLGTTDIATILRRYQSRSFGFASRNFYVSFLAATDVERNAEQYFGLLVRAPEEEYTTVTVDNYLPVSTLARKLGVDRAALREVNPALRTPVWKGEKYVPRGFTLRLPAGSAPEFAVAALADVEPEHRYDAQRPDHTHLVTRGETLSKIAAHYGVSVRSIVQANGLRSANHLRIGQVLQLPSGVIGTDPVRETTPAVAVDGRYVVRRGDSLSEIAARLGVEAAALAQRNDIADAHRIRVGQVLELPGTGVVTTGSATAGAVAQASAYVVRRGDALAVIARRYGFTEGELATLNGISDPDRIYVGQLLNVSRPQQAPGSLALADGPPKDAAATPEAVSAGSEPGTVATPVAAPLDAQPILPATPAQ